MKNILLILWMLSSFLSCKKNKGEKDDSLCSARSANNSGTIKLNGYYYYEYGNGAYRELYFLYSNGVLVSPGVVDSANFDEIDDYLNTNDFYTYYK